MLVVFSAEATCRPSRGHFVGQPDNLSNLLGLFTYHAGFLRDSNIRWDMLEKLQQVLTSAAVASLPVHGRGCWKHAKGMSQALYNRPDSPGGVYLTPCSEGCQGPFDEKLVKRLWTRMSSWVG